MSIAIAPDRELYDFLVQFAVALHRYGTPSHRLERVMTQVAASRGVDGIFLYTPTALVISLRFQGEETTYLRRVDSGAVNVDKLIRFDEILEAVEAHEIDIPEAARRLDEVSASAAPFPTWLTIVACTLTCAAVAVLFRGGLIEVAAAAGLGLMVALLELAYEKLGMERGMLEPLAGFLASVGALAIANFITPIDDRMVTLACLIVMIPGLSLTVALTELAVGHLSAGVARFAGAAVSLLTITIGVALGWRVAIAWRNLPTSDQRWHLADGWQWLAMLLAPLMFAIVFRARWPQWPTIVAVSVVGFLSSRYAGATWGTEVGAFAGALAVGIGSNLYARIRDRPALVPLTPGIIVLVPGSIGFRSLTAFLDHETMAGIDFAFTMVIVAIALVGGILTANAILPPKRIL